MAKIPSIALALTALTVAQGARAAAPSETQCSVQIVATPAQWQVHDIDVFANDPSRASFDLQLVNDSGTPCRMRLGVDLAGAPFGLAANGGKRVSYSLSDAASGSDITPRNGRSASTARRAILIPAHSETLARVDVLVSPEFETDGIFSQVLMMQATDDASGTVVAERAITLSAEVPASATIALSGNFTRMGSTADVDLGELQAGDVKVPLIMHIKSTRAYRIRSSSENDGRLVLAGTNWAIPYRLTMDGVTVDPARGVLSSTLGDKRRVDNMKLGFIISGVTGVAAGRYSDVVTLEIGLN